MIAQFFLFLAYVDVIDPNINDHSFQEVEVVPASELINDDHYCFIDGENLVGMNSVYLLEGPTYSFPRKDIEEAAIYGDNIRVVLSNGEGVINLDARKFLENGIELDLSLQFALVHSEVLVFWRETFQNRHYRFGLMNLEAGGHEATLIEVCEGLAGSFSE